MWRWKKCFSIAVLALGGSSLATQIGGPSWGPANFASKIPQRACVRAPMTELFNTQSDVLDLRFAGRAKPLSKLPDGVEIERLEIHALNLKTIKKGELVRLKVRTKDEGVFEGEGFVIRKFLSPMDLTRHKMKDPVFAERIKSILDSHPEIQAARDRGDTQTYDYLTAEAYRRRFREDFPPSLVVMDKATGAFHYLPQDLSDVWVNGVKSTEAAFDAVKAFVMGCKPQAGDDCFANSLFGIAVHNNEAGQGTGAEHLIKGRSTFETPGMLEDIHTDYIDYRDGRSVEHILDSWRRGVEQLTRSRGPKQPGFDALLEPELRALFVHLSRKGEVTDDIDDFTRFLLSGGRGVLAMSTQFALNNEITLARMPKGMRPIVDYRSAGQLSAVAGVTEDRGFAVPKFPSVGDADDIRNYGRHAMAVIGVHRFNADQAQAILANPQLRKMYRVPAGSTKVPPLIVAVDSNRSSEGTVRNLTRYFSAADLKNEPRLRLRDLPPKPWSDDQVADLALKWLLRRTFFIKVKEEAW